MVRSPHRPGVDPIADELIMRFGDFGMSGDEGDGTEEGAVELEPSDAAVDFRDRISHILQNNNDSFAAADNTTTASFGVPTDGTRGAAARLAAAGGPIPTSVSVKVGKSGKVPRVLGGTLDKDLKAYFIQEDQTRQLSNLGFFERDNFMDFD